MYKNYTKELAIVGALGLLVVSMQSNTNSAPLESSQNVVEEKKAETYYVIDASFIDHSGNYEECVKYADYYKDNHDYVVVSQTQIRDYYE